MEFELNKTQKDIQKAVRDFVKGEFDKGNLKHPFIISSDYYLYLKLKEIRDKFIKTKELDTSDEEVSTEKFD